MTTQIELEKQGYRHLCNPPMNGSYCELWQHPLGKLVYLDRYTGKEYVRD